MPKTETVSYPTLLKQTVSDWSEDKAPKLAASLATYAMLSLAPLLVIVTKIVGIIYRDESQAKVSSTLQNILPGIGAEAIAGMIKKAGEHGSGIVATTLSIVMAAYGATGVFAELQDSMNTIWEVKPKPLGIWGWIRARFLSLATVLGIAFLFMVSTVGSALVTTLGDKLSGGSQAVAFIATHIVSLAVMTLLFSMIFKLLPDAKVEWRDVWLGGVLTAVLFEVGKIGLAFYIKGSASSVFGAAGSFAALLLWIYYSAQILFFGAEFTQAYARTQGRGIQPSEYAERVTEEDRAQEGRPSPERMAARSATATTPAHKPYQPVRPYAQPSFMTAKDAEKLPYTYGATGAAIGAAAAALATWYIDQKLTTRKQVRSMHLQHRLENIESRVGRVSRLKDYVQRISVQDRINTVEKEIKRAGTHIRAQETARPKGMDKLGDLFGGRWSNV
jgi:membrane protein